VASERHSKRCVDFRLKQAYEEAIWRLADAGTAGLASHAAGKLRSSSYITSAV
jgi:hypothetical protein